MARSRFKAIPAGAPFLFKLHKPDHFIVGGGYFVGYSRLTLRMAWDAFGQDNGAPDFGTFRSLIEQYRTSKGLTTIDPEIGCVVLNRPFFLDEADWIPAPPNWANSIVQGKGYNTAEEIGMGVWGEVAAAMQGVQLGTGRVVREMVANYDNVFGNEYLRRARLGQGAFRAMITEAYHHRCCITGENTLPVLEAVHIKPVTQEGNHRIQNGLLMRADMHILYDRGLIGVTPDYEVRVSDLIREQWVNGKVYYMHDGEQLRSLPNDPSLHPDRDLLDWHMQTLFAA